jgi:hypothetical protein
MKLNTFFLLIISFICTLSEALPAGGQCVPANEGGGAIRNANGATVSAFQNQVRVRIVNSYIEPSSWAPWGGIFIDVVNDYCLRVAVTFALPDGNHHTFYVGARRAILSQLLPGHIPHNAVMQVTIEDAF